MKRGLACLMALVLLFVSVPTSVLAEVITSQTTHEEAGQEVSQKKASDLLEAEAVDTVNAKAVGTLEVEISYPQPRKALTDRAAVSLTNTAGEIVTISLKDVASDKKTASLGSQSIQYKNLLFDKNAIGDGSMAGSVLYNPSAQDAQVYYTTVNFYDLPVDTYTLTLSDTGLLPVTTTAAINTTSKRVEVNAKALLTGDVDGNGAIDDVDYDAVLAKLGTTEVAYDLNGDGTVDIIDLVYLQEGLSKTVDTTAIQVSETSPVVNPEGVKLESSAENPVSVKDGAISQLFGASTTATEVVGFQRQDGQSISTNTPLEIPLVMAETIQASQIRLEPSALGIDHAAKKGEVIVTNEAGNDEIYYFGTEESTAVLFLTDEPSENTIVIDLKGQTAIKKITIRVTETTKASSNLVEISKVEFLNNTKDKIVEQVSSIPTNVRATPGNESLSITWDAQANVTGYEVKMSFDNPKTGKNETTITPVDGNALTIGDLTNYVDYTISVQSVNRSDTGNWESGYSAPIVATPLPTSVPEAPEAITLSGGYRQITVNWEKQKNSTGYNVYYREKGKTEYSKIGGLTATSTVITDLKDQTEYEIYLRGYNAIGEGAASPVYRCETKSIDPPITSNYKLINCANGVDEPTAHITDITYPYLKEGDYENGFDQYDITDNDYTSYWNYGGWNAGGWAGTLQGPVVAFDGAYEMDDIVLIRGEGEPSTYTYMTIRWWDEAGLAHTLKAQEDFTISSKKTTNGKEYYRIQIKDKIKPVKIQINPALYWAGAPNARCRISELKFYAYDSLANETDALFVDDLHVELKDSVTMAYVDGLIERANTPDPDSGEFHPDKDLILSELTLAKSILSETNIDDTVVVDQNVSNAKNGTLGFAMSLNDFQPLGLAAKAGDTINVYVGTTGSVLPELVYTQYHPDIKTGWSKTVKLKKGKNEITLAQIGGEDSERGGALYIRYPNATATDKEIKVRVAGAVKTPTLNLTGITDAAAAKTKIRSYITELKAYATSLPSMYEGEDVRYPWDKTSSIYNATEIMMDQMLLSVPATAVVENLTGSEDAQVEQLYQNSLAMEQMMNITYTSKGLSRDAADNLDQWPGSRINVRYTRMFTGAFMYATGQHIGIEYGSVGGMVKGQPHKAQSNGTMADGQLYGWGIAHEIGHVTDEGDMVYGETSNNILSQLVKTFDEKEGARANYSAIYQKVTSGTTGYSSDVFTQLGMFWQLHLAYDDTPNSLDAKDSFYAKLYQGYRRNTQKTDKDNLLIRMASDAVQRDLTIYFEKWGLTANEETLAYVSKYPKEERAIYYLNDDARHKRIQKAPAMAAGTAVKATLNHTVENGKDSKQITLNLGVNKNQDAILGYEIVRNGQSVGFTTNNTYTDVIASMNNRVLNYEVIAYDNYLNKTEALALEPIKLQHDGSVAKTKWTMDSTMTSQGDTLVDEDCSDSGIAHPALKTLYDEDYANVYQGTKTSNNPSITINLQERMPVVGFKYTAAVVDGALAENTIKSYTIQVSEDGTTWQDATKGSFTVSVEEPSAIVYFNETDQEGANQLHTYQAGYVRLIANGAAGVSAAELDIVGPPGDNVNLEQSGIGILKSDFTYDPEQAPIKAGSLIFTGSYRGHPGFNALLLKDSQGNNVVGKDGQAESIFMATVPENGNIGEISQGTWIYWIDVDNLDMNALPDTVRAELYRVNNMETNEGQRLTSDTFGIALPATIPAIELTGAQTAEDKSI